VHSAASSPALLLSDDLEVVVDPRRGADILQIRHRALHLPLLFEVPWRKRADAVRSGALPASVNSFGRWLEGDAGGWQVLCPNAGAERDVEGGPVGFHGEASVVPWDVSAQTDSELQLSVELFSVPVRIERVITVEGTAVHVSDVLVNLGREAVRLDYSQHPSLGGALLDQPARLDTNAATFTADWEAPGAHLEPGAQHRWPHATTVDGSALDLRLVPGAEDPRALFGWLAGFPQRAWARLTSPACGVSVELAWDARQLPYAWLWQELSASGGFPWFGRARALAVEPGTTVTSGPDRADGLELAAGERRTFTVSAEVASTHVEGSSR
jgi:hypothetical protein